jgi:hypothetical protein
LNKLFNALLLSIPKLGNVLMILLLLLFLFSVMGVNIFGKTHVLGPHNIHANFRDSGYAFLTLLRCMTGEGWNELMQAFSRNSRYFGKYGIPCVGSMEIKGGEFYEKLEERCLIDKPVQCGNYWGSLIYFSAYTCVITFVILNLFVAVVLEGFDDTDETDEGEVITECIHAWKQYDPNLTLEIELMQAPHFVEHVQRRLRKRAGKPTDSNGIGMKQTFFVLGLMDVQNGKVHFRVAVEAVLRLVMAEDVVDKLRKGEGDEPQFVTSSAVSAKLATLTAELSSIPGVSNESNREWIKKMEAEKAPDIVREMAVRRMQMVFRAKRVTGVFSAMARETVDRNAMSTKKEEGEEDDGEWAANSDKALIGEATLPGVVDSAASAPVADPAAPNEEPRVAG